MFFVFFSLLVGILCYLRIDPIKSCLYLVLSLILVSPLISLGVQVWFSYFVCLVFLRGIFVILVYFSSLSKYNFYVLRGRVFIFFGVFLTPFYSLHFSNVVLFSIYFYNYIFIFV
jgi:hypothetical protein